MRVVLSWSVLAWALLRAAMHEAQPSRLHVVVAFALVGGVVGLGVPGALRLQALARGAVLVDATATTWRSWPRAVGGCITCVPIGACFASLASRDDGAPGALVTACGVLALIGAATPWGLRVAPRAAPRTSSLAMWCLVDTALPAALASAGIGATLAVVRFGATANVEPRVLARTLAGSCFVYALVGFAGFVKTFREHKAGVVVAPTPSTSLPGPVVVALVVGMALLFVGPRSLPALPGASVPWLKGGFGFVVGGALSALGAWRGVRVSALGRDAA